jgi:glycosyltransferase involved in cell wall biosynthesis
MVRNQCDLKKVRVIEKWDKDSVESEEEFVSILNQTDFFILPIQMDCSPIVIAEAFSTGVPVLSTDTGGSDGINRFLFAQEDVQGYVQRITQLMNVPLQSRLFLKLYLIVYHYF